MAAQIEGQIINEADDVGLHSGREVITTNRRPFHHCLLPRNGTDKFDTVHLLMMCWNTFGLMVHVHLAYLSAFQLVFAFPWVWFRRYLLVCVTFHMIAPATSYHESFMNWLLCIKFYILLKQDKSWINIQKKPSCFWLVLVPKIAK